MTKPIIVIGSGLAGLGLALELADTLPVIIMTKRSLHQSNSRLAQGGIAAALGKDDSFAKHYRDTIQAGAKHNIKSAVQLVVQSAPQRIAWLEQLGVQFSQDLTREGGHQTRRVVHVADHTGQAIMQVLWRAVQHHPNIQLLPYHQAVQLICTTTGTVAGVLVLDIRRQRCTRLFGQAVVLATGGSGQVYQHTTNPSGATGDGIALAYQVKAKLKDLEFIQFHPTALQLPGKPAALISEAVRGEGAYIVNHRQQRFINELAPRDTVSRAIVQQLTTGPVYLDLRHLGRQYICQRFPSITKQLKRYGINPATQLIPIAPAAHYQCGGVVTNQVGATTIPGLYAIGEVAATGLHGANRLASNSLLECIVYAHQASEHIMQRAKQQPTIKPKLIRQSLPMVISADTTSQHLRRQIQVTMWQQVGVIRQAAGLRQARDKLRQLVVQADQLCASGLNQQRLETAQLARVGYLIAAAAVRRQASLGCHYRLN
ncbi:MAG: L-aspartate oxidase [Candidatus Kerfeldbacteria bacterium]|nr:L-aspartate oxidase [Candidatus Kerfeldbacteria bacterium]